MKKTLIVVLGLFLFVMAVDLTAQSETDKNKNELIATYKGKTNDRRYSFVDEKGKTQFFNKIAPEVEISLSDKDDMDKKFVITWEYKNVVMLSYEGEPEESITIKLITGLKYFDGQKKNCESK